MAEKGNALTVAYKDKEYRCVEYGDSAESKIVDIFFSWKMLAISMDRFKGKKPQMIQDFSESLCCYVCNLKRNLSRVGPDAFRRTDKGNWLAVEIKATTSSRGRDDVKLPPEFDELYWLDLAEYESLEFRIYRMTTTDFRDVTGRERGRRVNVQLRNIVESRHVRALRNGRIGIVLGTNNPVIQSTERGD